MPDIQGPIIQILTLRYGLGTSIERTIRGLVDADVVGDVQQGALFVTGERTQILRVIDVVGLMDQPAQRGRHVGLVSLTYIAADEFLELIVFLLTILGVRFFLGSGAGVCCVELVFIESIGSVAVFAASRQLLERVD